MLANPLKIAIKRSGATPHLPSSQTSKPPEIAAPGAAEGASGALIRGGLHQPERRAMPDPTEIPGHGLDDEQNPIPPEMPEPDADAPPEMPA
jgi:hypothetical protein